jgi:F-type H+-transporting ATPase subunit delta
VSAKAQPRDYAQAIYELALEPWTRQLSEVQKTLKENPSLRRALSDSATPPAERLSMLEQVSPRDLTEQFRKFLGKLLEDGQVEQLGAILAEYERLTLRREELRQAYVTSAVALTDSEKQALRARLTEQYGSDLELHFDLDASLLGGIRLRVGDRVIDGSVAGKLAAMRDRLTT